MLSESKKKLHMAIKVATVKAYKLLEKEIGENELAIELLRHKERDSLIDLDRIIKNVKAPEYNNNEKTMSLLYYSINDTLDRGFTSFYKCASEDKTYGKNVNVDNCRLIIDKYVSTVKSLVYNY
jgi:hypothetical protein